MAGRRRESRWHQRMVAAGTPAEELEVAYDRLRAAIAHACRKRRDVSEARASEALATAAVREVTAALTRAAEALEEREKVTVRDR